MADNKLKEIDIKKHAYHLDNLINVLILEIY